MSRVSNRANIAERTAVQMPTPRRWKYALCAMVLMSATAIPVFAARSVAQKKQVARTEFETAEDMRDALNAKPAAQRKQRDYTRVIDAYRKVYYTAPTSSKADPAVFTVAELLLEEGRAFKSEHSLQEAIGQYEFLRKEYPGSKYRVQSLFTIAQVYKDDLGQNDKARETLQEFLKHYPHSELSDDARQALKDLDEEASAQARKSRGKPPEKTAETQKPDLKSPEVKSGELQKVDLKPEETASPENQFSESHHGKSLVTGIRHWSTPDYTRIAVDLENEVKWDSGRIPRPDRIYFDLKDTRLSAVLKGKSFDVDDGYLKKIRIAQFAPGLTRVVLEVGDDVSEYSAFLLPNPYRLVIDIHGKRPAMLLAKKNDSPAKPVEPAVKPSEKPAEKETTIAKLEPPKVEPAKLEVPKPELKKTEVKQSVETKPAPKGTEQPATSSRPETKSDTGTVAKTAEPVKKIVDEDTGSKPPVVAKATAPPVPSVQHQPAATRHGKKHGATESFTEAKVREAQPTSDGDRSLIRALGLKIGRIVIDAGHGGHDTGTIGPDGVREKDVVLDVALKLGKLLEDRLGAEVVYTRDDDTFIPLETRTAIANQQQADLFISIHANSSRDPSARGVETYYLNFTSSRDALEVAARENAVSQQSIHELQDLVKKIALKEKIEESRELAADVQQSLHTGLSAKAPAIRDRGVKKAPFIVLIGANMPSILAEISFISNPTDEHKLETSEYREKIADSLYKGIAKYVGGLSGVKVAAKMGSEPGD
jgi:N-acetylmuramoyl-L-alanine amidase